MKKPIILLLSLIALFSCKDKTEPGMRKVSHDKKEKQLHNKNTEQKPVAVEKIDDTFEILIPRQYRDFGNENDVDKLKENWLDLYQKDGKYYLGKADYTITKGFSECSGDSTKIINSKNNSILFLNSPQLAIGEIKTVNIKKNKIWPKEKLKFNFENKEYTLRAEGKVLSSEKVHTDNGEEIYQNVKNYKLYISTLNSPEQLFLEEESFNDTFVELLFIGDIDKDGKPDFIFGANRDYEEERVILYLSSKAAKGKLIKKISEISIQFDC